MKNDGFSLNVRLLGILVLAGIVASAGVVILHHFQVKRQSSFFLDEARSGVEDLDTLEDPLVRVDKVKGIGQNYQRYLAQNTDDIEIEAELALLYADSEEKDYRSRRRRK